MAKTVLLLFLSFSLVACQSTPEAANSNYAQFRLNQVIVDFTRTERPILVAELDAELSRTVATSAAGALGTRLVLMKHGARTVGYKQEIERNIKPHIRDALTPLMGGAYPLDVIVEVESTFLRSRVGLTRLTGAEVYINGQKRPDQEQFIASVILIDVQSGVRFERIGPIKKTDNGAVTIWESGPKAPEYGKGKRLNQLIYKFAQEVATRMKEGDGNANLSSAEIETLFAR